MSGKGYESRWEIINELSEGGQGKCFIVRDTEDQPSSETLFKVVQDSVRKLSNSVIPAPDPRRDAFDRLRMAIIDIINDATGVAHRGVLKVLHEPEDARDPGRAVERLNREIKSMATVSHSNLLKILDADAGEHWYVSEYHPNGTLADRLDRFVGDVVAALRAFRPLAAGVARLHEQGLVHRDIKPQNIFVSSTDDLILGDFGLVYFTDDKRTRLSATLDNVGTRDWMPQWAMGMRVEDIKPTFDVFALGKVLWSMISGLPFLRLWYYKNDQFNVEKLFPDNEHARLVNLLFAKCIVEEEGDCLPDAATLVAEVDKTVMRAEKGGDVLGDHVERRCLVCGNGKYELIVNEDRTAARNFGIQASGSRVFKPALFTR